MDVLVPGRAILVVLLKDGGKYLPKFILQRLIFFIFPLNMFWVLRLDWNV